MFAAAWDLIATAYIGALFALFIAGLALEPLLLIYMALDALLHPLIAH